MKKVLATIFLLASIPTAVVYATFNHNDVRICHATGNGGYVSLEVDDDAVNGIGNGDHNRIGHQNGNDIIPPGSWDPDGRNWILGNILIWHNSCNAPTPSPSPSASPSTSPSSSPSPSSSIEPSATPSPTPSPTPSASPSSSPQDTPSPTPSTEPSLTPTPEESPTVQPSPSNEPTPLPSDEPEESVSPSPEGNPGDEDDDEDKDGSSGSSGGCYQGLQPDGKHYPCWYAYHTPEPTPWPSPVITVPCGALCNAGHVSTGPVDSIGLSALIAMVPTLGYAWRKRKDLFN